ncbi:MAG: hypothetical protein ACHQX1_01565 [Candidatus Micrarchaeales archaeon]
MRSADTITILRVIIAIALVYGVLAYFNPYVITFGIILITFMDALDGMFAIREVSNGKIGFSDYVRAEVFGDQKLRKLVRLYKDKIKDTAPHGARFDIAGDRAVEYLFWLVYTYLNLVPFFVFVIVIIRHSFVDALMGAKGTSSKMKTRFARVVYSSNFGRAFVNLPKILAFSYLAFVYVYGWPLWIGYIFVAILVINILLRGIAEVYESFAA